MVYQENQLTYEAYVSLRNAVGWIIFSENQITNSIGNSRYIVTVEDDGQVIAMERLIGDGMYYIIADVVVRPEHQKCGIGGRILDMLVAYAEKETPHGGRTSIQLIAEKGKEAFYIKKGFKKIPHEHCGSGMRKIIRK